MAKADLNPVMLRIRGHIGDLLFRSVNDRMVLGRKPIITTRPPTPAQVNVRERFQLAMQYASSAILDPVLGPFYTALAGNRRRQPRVVAAADYLSPPRVHSIDASGYHGAAGNVIKVRASDDVGVIGVTVRIRDATGAVLEEDPATLAQGVWSYPATSVVAAGTPVTIEAVATDRAGNNGMATLPVIVA